MFWLILAVASLTPPQTPASQRLDITTLKVTSPVVVSTIDTGKLKGELRQLDWSPDGQTIYLQTEEPEKKFHNYTVPLTGGAVTALEEQPQWAAEYWNVKQDRAAPGIPSLVINVTDSYEKPSNVGQTGALDRSADAKSAAGQMTPHDVTAAMDDTRVHVWRLDLLGQTIAVLPGPARPVPGSRFSWGPAGSGTLVYVDEKGHLVLFDSRKHRQVLKDVSDAFLPAWSTDGSRLACARKTGRKTFDLVWMSVDR